MNLHLYLKFSSNFYTREFIKYIHKNRLTTDKTEEKANFCVGLSVKK